MLAALQSQMAQAVFDRGDEAAALTLFRGDVTKCVNGLALYRGNLSATWEKSLGAAYPVLRALVGEEFFVGLTRVFGRHHPSTEGDLHRYGAHFAHFLATFAPVEAYPYFPDMARYEWALHRAHFAEPAVPLERSALALMTPQQLEQLHVRLHPACTLLTSSWAVSSIWRAHQQTQDCSANDIDALPEFLTIRDFAVTVRPQWRVDLLPLSQAAYQALCAVTRGASLGDAVDAALAIDADFAFSDALQQWIDHAMLCPIERE